MQSSVSLYIIVYEKYVCLYINRHTDIYNIFIYSVFKGMCVCALSHVQLFVTLWTVAHQAPLSMGFSRRKYWRGLHALLQGIFLTQGSNPHLLCLALAGEFFTTSATWEAQVPVEYVLPKQTVSRIIWASIFFFFQRQCLSVLETRRESHVI